GLSLLASEGLSCVFRQAKGCDGREGECAGEEHKEPGLAGHGENGWNNERGDNRGNAAEAGCSSGAAAADLGGVKFGPNRVKCAPCAEVEEGQQAAREDDADVRICHAESSGG